MPWGLGQAPASNKPPSERGGITPQTHWYYYRLHKRRRPFILKDLEEAGITVLEPGA